MAMSILVAEDEANIRRLVAYYLAQEGYRVIEAADGAEALLRFAENPELSLVILDIMMPERDGYSVCREIREHSQVPVLMLTARDTDRDEVEGLRCGADEYITKPFSHEVLVMRVKNLLRRVGREVVENLTVQGLEILSWERLVISGGTRVILTPKEFDLLCYLVRNKGLVLTRQQILDRIWGQDYQGDDRTVDTHVKCLRAKLGTAGAQLITIRKVGYKFEEAC